ncbi:retrovirus-related pol polyprotein from transposon TNT 1-94, partial [Tanacetum coccineum]
MPHTEDTEGPPDLMNTKGTHEQNVQNDQMVTQPTDAPLGNNTKIPGSITEPLVPDVTQSHISNQASTSSHPAPQDRWSRDQHIKLVNIIGNPGEGMLTRSMAAMLTVASASECLFADFLFEIEPKKEEGIDYYETFAPVARMEAIRIFLAFATYNFKFYQIDVKSAFLNGKLKEEVYVKQPPGFESSEFPDYVCKLDKALYGLKQAQRAWYETLSTFLIQNKFTRERIDNTLFIYKSKGEVIIVQVYIDDIIFGLTSYKLCKQFEKLMTNKFKISMMGELTYFLGLQIKQDDKGISICQEQYTMNVHKKYEISDSSSVKTLMVPPSNLGLDLVGKSVNETSYRGMIGSLMYLTATRPDIQFSTVLCARYQSNTKESHLTVVKRILMYLKVAMSLAEAEYVAAAGCCDPSKVIDIELTAHMIDVNNRMDSVSLPPLVAKPKKGKSQTVASTLPKDIQLTSTGLPSTLDEGTRKSKPLPESTATHPKDLGGNKQPLARDIPFTTPDEGTTKTTTRPEGSLGDKDSGGNIPPADMEPIHTHVADLSGTGATYQTFADIQAYLLFEDELDKYSDEEEVLVVGDDMDEDIQATKEVRTPSPKQDQLEPSQVQEYAFDSSSPDLKKFDNI